MKNSLMVVLFVILFFYFSSSTYATLQSNLIDPGITRNNWIYLENANCRNGSQPKWWLHSDGANTKDGTPCTGPLMGQSWNFVNGHYEVTLSLNNTVNTNRCRNRTYYGLQPGGYPQGAKNILYFKDLSSVRVRVTIANSPLTGACDDQNNPTCQRAACSSPPSAGHWGNSFGDTELLMGIPMYDETNKRNLFLEISPFWTKNAVYGGPADDPNSNYYLFWGESPQYELVRIMITHPLVNKSILPSGQTAMYDIDVLPIIKSLKWGRTNQIDWNKLHLTDAYVGGESYGWAQTNFTVSNLDFLYDTVNFPGDLSGDGQVDIFDYNLLITDFGKTGAAGWIPADINSDGKVDIFDYNILVGNFGRTP